MCTVTYIPVNKTDFILTSSRDVPYKREKANTPKEYIENGIKITYPKDGEAGGTWIGTSEKNRLICLLNGGFTNHIPKKEYRKSRGIIVKDLLLQNEINSALSEINLFNIAPFTLIIADWNEELRLIEFVWDGEKKHLKNLPQKMHIWSSATLYDANMKQQRESWFMEWQHHICPQHLNNHERLENYRHKILNFHQYGGVGNSKIDILMKRENVGTVSITQVSKQENDIKMTYLDVF
ncbi:MAG TPA: hypothetical protein ENK67_06730 [Flavobacteriia bacterium]|nr:hypothetical protein [Flavobacteriia bacterium]